MKTTHYLIAPLCVALSFLYGCSSAPPTKDCYIMDETCSSSSSSQTEDAAHRVTAADREAALELRRAKEQDLKEAYDRGARDTLDQFQSTLRARRGFVYEPPIIENVDINASCVSGACYPRHNAPMILSPGRWIEQNSTPTPEGGSK